MRRPTGAILFLASSVCFVGALATQSQNGQILVFPGIVLLGMGIYQFARGREDDRKDS